MAMRSSARGVTALLIGTVVLLGASTVASAEARKPLAPIATDGLRECGDGGFALPGSAGCIRLGGAVGVEGTWRSGRGAPVATSLGRPSSLIGRARARLDADVRVPTELGPLRVYTSIRATAPDGPASLR